MVYGSARVLSHHVTTDSTSIVLRSAGRVMRISLEKIDLQLREILPAQGIDGGVPV